MSSARFVPETWELGGDEARETLLRTGHRKLARDAFVRFRASDGFSHARSLAFLTSLLLVQGLILLVGLAAWLGDTDLSATIVRTISEAVPGPAGKALTNAVFHAYRTGASGQHLVLLFIGVTTLITGSTLMGQIERALNRLYGIEQDRPTLQKYGRAFLLTLTAGKASVRIPYKDVNTLEYGLRVSRRYVEAALLSPLFLVGKKKTHFLTIGYSDAEGRQQAMVLQVGSGDRSEAAEPFCSHQFGCKE